MEANKIKGEEKYSQLDNGVELTYCECGQETKSWENYSPISNKSVN